MSWGFWGRLIDLDTNRGVAGAYINISYYDGNSYPAPFLGSAFTFSDHDGYFQFRDAPVSTIHSDYGVYGVGTIGYPLNVPFSYDFYQFTANQSTDVPPVFVYYIYRPSRHRHPRDLDFHRGQDVDTNFDISTVFPTLGGVIVSLHDLLSALVLAVRNRAAQHFTIYSYILMPSLDLPSWAWVTKLHDTSDTRYQLFGAGFGNGYCVAVGSVNTMFTAPVGETVNPLNSWTAHEDPGFGTNSIQDVLYDGSLWVAVGGSGMIRTAPDPTGTWTAQTSNITKYLRGITQGGSEYVAFGGDGAGPGFTTTTDPTAAWTNRDASVFHDAGASNIVQIIYANSEWVAITDSGHIFTASAASGTWTNLGRPVTGFLGLGIAYGNGWYVATGYRFASGYYGGPWISQSPSGPWTELDLSYRLTGAIGFADETFVVIGQSQYPYLWHVRTAQFPNASWTVRDTLTTMTGSNNTGLATDGVRSWLVLGDDSDSDHPTIDFAWSTSPTQFHIDAILVHSGTGSYTVDAYLSGATTGSASVDAVLFKTLAWSLPGDADIRRSESANYTIDAYLTRSVMANLTINAVTSKTTSGSLSTDADIRRSESGSYTIDAYLTRAVSSNIALDAVLAATGSGSFAIDAVIQVTWGGWSATGTNPVFGALTIDAVIGTAGSVDFQSDAFQADTFG